MDRSKTKSKGWKVKVINKKINRLIELTKSQKKYLMASSLDLYFKTEDERKKIRKDIDKRVSRIRMEPDSKREYREKLDILRSLDKDNRKILIDLMQQADREKESLRKDRIISEQYYAKNQLKESKLSFNRIL